MRFSVNGIELGPGMTVDPDRFDAAGLARVPHWQRLFRGLPVRCSHWEATDPRVECFDGRVQIYPCRHRYLDHDRRWGTNCLLTARGDELTALEVRVIDGLYAAGNLFELFVDAARTTLGEADHESANCVRWYGEVNRLIASYRRTEHGARFRLEANH